MAGRSAGEGRRISGATFSLIVISFSELRKDLRHLLESRWEEPVRRRAHELASTLADACDRQGLKDVAVLARSLANLARLSKEQAATIQPALAEKFDSLQREAQRLLSLHSKQQFG